MPATTETRKILIKVDAPGVKEALDGIASKMGSVNKNTKSLADNLGFLTNAFKGVVAYFGVRELARMSDEFQNLSARLKINALEGENVSDTLAKISGLADRTKQSISAVGDTYTRFAGSLKSVNATSDELVALTETLINTFKVSGSGADETANAMIQLSQAFSTGVLRGQDLRSVISQNVVFARYLKEEYKGDIFKKAESGAITISEVLRILSKHQKELTAQAKELAPTFSQTLTLAFNKVTIAVGELSQKMELSKKFADIMAFGFEHVGEVMIIVTGLMIPIIGSYIPAMIAGIRAMYAASLLFLKNPLLLALAGIITVAVLVYENFDRITAAFQRFRAGLLDLVADIEEKLLPLRQSLDNLFRVDTVSGQKKDIEDLRKAAKGIRLELEAAEKAKAKAKASKEKDQNADLLSLRKKVSANEAPKTQKIKEILADLNKELAAGKIGLDEYNKKLVSFELYKLNREFKEGKFDIFEYNKRLRELDIHSLNRDVKNGVTSLSEYREAVRNANIAELNAKFKAGRISLVEYNTELAKISEKFLPGSALVSGTSAYIESIGTLSDNIAKGITSTFSHLEDTLVDFVKTGEFNFSKFTQAVLDDLTRIIIRAAILRPLANGILNTTAVSATPELGPSVTAASGQAFYNGNLQKFARGGIVNSPTAFQYGGGKRGLMGEAGTEAILPLKRTSGGALGVAASTNPVTVNIINQSGSSVQQTESTGPNGEKTIDIMIANRVRDGILTGRFDTAMKGAYGLNRKGS